MSIQGKCLFSLHYVAEGLPKGKMVYNEINIFKYKLLIFYMKFLVDLPTLPSSLIFFPSLIILIKNLT